MAGVGIRQALEAQIRESGELVRLERLTDREHKDDRLRLHPPCHEGQHLRGGAIEPLGVVDQAQKRPFVGRLGQQAEHRETDQESIGPGPRAQPERGPKRIALWDRQAAEAVQQRATQLV